MAKRECRHKTTTYARLRDGTVLVACSRCGKRIETIKGINIKTKV